MSHIAEELDIDPYVLRVLYGQVLQESTANKDLVSSANAHGVLQWLPTYYADMKHTYAPLLEEYFGTSDLSIDDPRLQILCTWLYYQERFIDMTQDQPVERNTKRTVDVYNPNTTTDA